MFSSGYAGEEIARFQLKMIESTSKYSSCEFRGSNPNPRTRFEQAQFEVYEAA